MSALVSTQFVWEFVGDGVIAMLKTIRNGFMQLDDHILWFNTIELQQFIRWIVKIGSL